jgi:uncharacterized membrane protein YqhA
VAARSPNESSGHTDALVAELRIAARSAAGASGAPSSIERAKDSRNRTSTNEPQNMKPLERIFERLLWNSRLITLVAVIASLVVAIIMFYVATTDVAFLIREVIKYATLPDDARAHEHAAIVATIAEIVDGYLFATILIIFGLGLYELFISKIDAIESSPIAQRVLLIRSLDDLKERLAKVVFLILIVRYFQYALESPIKTPLDLLYLAIGIALIAVALYLTQGKHNSGDTGMSHAEPATENDRAATEIR